MWDAPFCPRDPSLAVACYCPRTSLPVPFVEVSSETELAAQYSRDERLALARCGQTRPLLRGKVGTSASYLGCVSGVAATRRLWESVPTPKQTLGVRKRYHALPACPRPRPRRCLVRRHAMNLSRDIASVKALAIDASARNALDKGKEKIFVPSGGCRPSRHSPFASPESPGAIELDARRVWAPQRHGLALHGPRGDGCPARMRFGTGHRHHAQVPIKGRRGGRAVAGSPTSRQGTDQSAHPPSSVLVDC